MGVDVPDVPMRPPAVGWDPWQGHGDRRGWQRRIGGIVATVVVDDGASEFPFSIVEEPTRVRLATGTLHVSLERTCLALGSLLAVLRPSTTREVPMIGDVP